MRNRNSYLPLHSEGFHNPNTNSGSCGCNSCNSYQTPTAINNLAVYRNSTNRRTLNGPFDDLLSNFTGAIGTGKPLVAVDIGLSNDTMFKLGLGAIGLLFLNREINKK